MLAFVSVALAVADFTLASLSTYAVASILLMALAIVTVKTAMSAQPTGSLGQLLYETEHPPSVPNPHVDGKEDVVRRW
jgi:hypothetical protein